MPRTIIHIGMPRTASTFLQQEFFPKVEDFQFYGVDTTQYSAAFQRLLYQDDSLFDKSEFEKTAAEIFSENAILSNELFTGQSLYLNVTNRSRTAKRLHQFFPEAEIVLVLRNQVSLLQSLYAIGVYSGHTCKPEAFIRFSDEVSTVENPLYPTFAEAENTETYKYTPLVKLYQSLFTKVHVLLFEDFKVDPTAFAERLSEILKIAPINISKPQKKVNRSLSARQIKVTRGINRLKPILYRGEAGRLLFGKSIQTIEHKLSGKESYRFSDALREKIVKTYAADNRELMDVLPEYNDSETFKRNYLSV